jgi:thiol-disulfide isomerase/thioredoxin
MTSALLAMSLLAGPGELKLIPSGMTQKMGGYMPMRAEMTSDAGKIAQKPADLKAPSYGVLKIGSDSIAFILDEPEGSPAKLYVDTNNNGDLTDDPATKWDARKQNDLTMYMGTAQIKLGDALATLGVYRLDKSDPQRAALKSTLLYYTDFGYEGELKIGDKNYKASLAGAIAPGARIWLDRNGNGKNDGRSETVTEGKPFNFGGTSYELKAGSGKFDVSVSQTEVAEIPLPPDLSVGTNVPKFEATATDGTKISFPESYKGKLVMLDFWATWCGPCVAELPNVLKAYEKYHDKGFEILGISFDQANCADKLASFTKEKGMAWRQVYEGKYWETTIGTQFGVEGIPFCLLVDGSTGKIIATVNNLRGANLEKTLEAAFAQKGGK